MWLNPKPALLNKSLRAGTTKQVEIIKTNKVTKYKRNQPS
jgi:hypothetical protein